MEYKSKKIGWVLFCVSTTLLIAQFVIAFNTNILPNSNTGYSLIINLAPIVLWLTSMYILFSSNQLTLKVGGKLFLTLVASYGAIGGVFIVSLVGLSMLEANSRIDLFSWLPVFMLIGIPLMTLLIYKYIK